MTANFEFGVDLFNQVLACRILGNIAPEDARDVAAQIEKATRRITKGRAKLLVDARAMVRGKPIEWAGVASELHDTLPWLLPCCSHIAVLCNDSNMKSEVDGWIVGRGLSSVLRSFYHPDGATALRQVYAFLGIETNQVVAA